MTHPVVRRLAWPLLPLAIVPVGAAYGQPRGTESEPYAGSCRPPLKFMAGACVPQCYAGYEDRGH